MDGLNRNFKPGNERENYWIKEIEKHGLLSDVFNEWMFARGISSVEATKKLEKIRTYEERLRWHKVSAPDAQSIIDNSDKNKIDKFNKYVALFNSELDAIKLTGDFKRANEIAELVFKELYY